MPATKKSKKPRAIHFVLLADDGKTPIMTTDEQRLSAWIESGRRDQRTCEIKTWIGPCYVRTDVLAVTFHADDMPFVTMVFTPKTAGDFDDMELMTDWLSPTFEEAEIQHATVCEALRGLLADGWLPRRC